MSLLVVVLALSGAVATVLIGLVLLRLVRPQTADKVESFLRFRRPSAEAASQTRTMLVFGLIAAAPLTYLLPISWSGHLVIYGAVVVLAGGNLLLAYLAQRSSRVSSK